MSYDDSFYRAYEDYLNEPAVVEMHELAVSLLGRPSSLFDLGCGRSNEILRRCSSPTAAYVGIDANAVDYTSFTSIVYRTIPGDYRNGVDLERALLGCRGIETFCSLFSVEITAPKEQNYALYRKLFQRGFKLGLVSGFYYALKRDRNPIQEAGGLTSWQTLERPEDVVDPLFTEVRLTMPVPSKLFGPDVYEVWKLFRVR